MLCCIAITALVQRFLTKHNNKLRMIHVKLLCGVINLTDNIFKWRYFEKEIILLCVRWYLKYPLSYRNLIEIMAERGIAVTHTTIIRWGTRLAASYATRLISWDCMRLVSWMKTQKRGYQWWKCLRILLCRSLQYDDDWETLLELNGKGDIKNTLSNMILVLRHDPNLQVFSITN